MTQKTLKNIVLTSRYIKLPVELLPKLSLNFRNKLISERLTWNLILPVYSNTQTMRRNYLEILPIRTCTTLCISKSKAIWNGQSLFLECARQSLGLPSWKKEWVSYRQILYDRLSSANTKLPFAVCQWGHVTWLDGRLFLGLTTL